jgi:protoporphyrinogen oxidase
VTAGSVHALPGRGVGIVGGGLLGLTVGYRLAKRGVPVSVYEQSDQLGGLAGTTRIGGVEVDRYYHAVTTEDRRVLDLAEELGLGDSVRWRRLGVGFYQDGRLASMSTPRELLSFPGLTTADRARLVAFVLRCRMISDRTKLDATPIEPWTRRVAGDGLWDRLWRPLLESKFDGRYADLPATYLWSRMRRTAGTRDKSGQEVMGWIRGGHQALADALGDAIRAHGGEVLTGTPVRFIPSVEGVAQGVTLDSGFRRHDWVVSTLLRPHMKNLLGPELAATLPEDTNRYLGVVCVVARVRRSVSPYYALNITDRSIPLTSVVETTHVVDPEHVGGHLLYVPRYVNPDSPELGRSSDDITREYLGHVRTMFPGFRPDEDVIASQVARARIAEPIHRAGVEPRLPELVTAPGLVLASSAHVYPDIVHAQAIVGVADRVTTELTARLPGVLTTETQRSAA